jgi:hypothetical protein
MRKWLRRIRGAIGMGFTWAAAWFTAGLVPRWVFGVNADVPFPALHHGSTEDTETAHGKPQGLGGCAVHPQAVFRGRFRVSVVQGGRARGSLRHVSLPGAPIYLAGLSSVPRRAPDALPIPCDREPPRLSSADPPIGTATFALEDGCPRIP